MTDVMLLADQVSTPIKIAWVLWLAWAFVQTGWYRLAHTAPVPVSQPIRHVPVERPKAAPMPRPEAAARKPVASGEVAEIPADPVLQSQQADTAAQPRRRGPRSGPKTSNEENLIAPS